MPAQPKHRRAQAKRPKKAARARARPPTKSPFGSLRADLKLVARYRNKPLNWATLSAFVRAEAKICSRFPETAHAFFIEHCFPAKESALVANILILDSREKNGAFARKLLEDYRKRFGKAKGKRMLVARLERNQSKFRQKIEEIQRIKEEARQAGKEYGQLSHVLGNRFTPVGFGLRHVLEAVKQI